MHKNRQLDNTVCVIPPQVSLDGFASLAVPVYRASTIVFPDPVAYRNRATRAPDGYTYGLSGTPTTRTLESQLSAIHNTERAIVLPSGQAAISATMLTLLKKGDHLLVTDNVYPPVKHLARKVLGDLGIETEFFDPTRMADLEERLRPGRTRLVWVESPGSTSMEISDIPAISHLSKAAGAWLGCDNTWATGLLCKPLELGVDIVAEALTKYVGGHSDILLGAIILRDMELYGRIRNTLGSLGVGVSPDECSLALRGVQTMGLRLRHVGDTSEEFAHRLAENCSYPVLHPCLSSFSGHALWQRDFKGSSGVFSLQLDGASAETVDRALDGLKTFAIGASWGGTRSIIAPIRIAHDRHVMSKSETTTYLRISIGLENIDDLWADLQRILRALRQ
ncbi:MAG: aminotransferase class I/II-fold pyridoxal phosphate-dependent enzyme [Mesorhizobium sp.]|uniref:trans-sulfuration enzyme family protein n=3 Tax=Mesorhizobium TaxID=68287 RepID=UPI000FD58A7C|nr:MULTISPECIES: PLP-dependent transferase [unclassified Mesorhizobium]MCT2581093.1 aminotransferase class I/II-fold pyridoxal phosphate-dependent enzyme [Mesorhizobium sp. P13.3]MDF3170147.1 aminotransferase class I/II-fold pyridoxal phosphate-dependent enzyme [Mesorhizobium sp. P16.1]MDF3181093.1 aminotransferase class I/II-fold pyridoxal phosphate-dependent enzyme [Mesorhizobium sp. P17.1]MDF3187006.1 aminotransferase class I/II-fold pyridoxal phosphate-dependent enzyme [Mesorhizobium sp. IC